MHFVEKARLKLYPHKKISSFKFFSFNKFNKGYLYSPFFDKTNEKKVAK